MKERLQESIGPAGRFAVRKRVWEKEKRGNVGGGGGK